MIVSLYVRERGTRKQKKHNPKKIHPVNGSIIWGLRYGTTWETLDVKSLGEATTLPLRRQFELDGAWRPTTKVKLARTYQWNVALEQSLGSNQSLSLT
jgi:hypothetical protein